MWQSEVVDFVMNDGLVIEMQCPSQKLSHIRAVARECTLRSSADDGCHAG